MYIYLIGFAISVLFFFLSTKFNKNKIANTFFTIMGILIPCLIAGLRSENIGTDVKIYIKPLFECAKNATNIKEYFSLGWSIGWRIKSVSEFEYGFSLFIYLISRVFKNLQIVLFFIQLMTIVPTYFGIKKFVEFKDKIWLGILIYLFVFFSFSLNAMRQMIGISMVFYAFSLLINSKKSNLKCLFIIFIAMLFHKSSALGFLIYIIYKIIMKQEKSNTKIKIGLHSINLIKLTLILFIFAGVIIVFNSSLINSLINILGFEKYSGYLKNEITISQGQLLIRIPILYFFITQYKNMINKDKNNLFLLIIFILDILFTNLSSASMYSSRIGIIFFFFIVISLPIMSNISKNKNNNKLNTMLVILYSIIYWYYMYILSGVGHVNPYEFFF